jgi:trehalose 6-phosphate phosphatase
LRSEKQPAYFFGQKSRPGIGDGGILLLIDFDGTLVPIREDPSSCRLSSDTEETLGRLARSGKCTVAVVSGRSLSDLRKRISIEGLSLSGSHGLEIAGPYLSYRFVEAESGKRESERARKALRKEIKGVEGAVIEKKVFSFALHYRKADGKSIPFLKKTFNRVVKEAVVRGTARVVRGKKVLELVPETPCNKGTAGLAILQALAEKRMPVCVGDDLTDEALFSTFRDSGVTLRVGKSRTTTAEYYLKSQSEVLRFLRYLQDALGLTGDRPGEGVR